MHSALEEEEEEMDAVDKALLVYLIDGTRSPPNVEGCAHCCRMTVAVRDDEEESMIAAS